MATAAPMRAKAKVITEISARSRRPTTAGSEKFSKHVVCGDGACLLDLLSRSRAKAEQRYGVQIKAIVIQEAGLDGFWIHRLLLANGIESHVVDGWTAAWLGRLRFHTSMEATDAVCHLCDRCRDHRPREQYHAVRLARIEQIEMGCDQMQAGQKPIICRAARYAVTLLCPNWSAGYDWLSHISRYRRHDDRRRGRSDVF